MEKANSRALNAQVDKLKKIIIKIGVNPDDQPTVQKLLQSTKSEIGSFKKKLNLPIAEHPLAARIAEVKMKKKTSYKMCCRRLKKFLYLKKLWTSYKRK